MSRHNRQSSEELLEHILHELRENNQVLHEIRRELAPKLSQTIVFKEITMLPTIGGNTLVYTGTLAPAGSVLAPDFVAIVTSNDPNVSPVVDPTGLIVAIPLPSGWVESASTPLAISYATTSASTGQALAATITPSVAVDLASSISFAQTQ